MIGSSESEPSLPEWYPLANASSAEVDQWLTAKVPPFAGMRQALPWLNTDDALNCWLEGLRFARANGAGAYLNDAFPSLSAIPLPPRRAAGSRL